MIATQAIPVLCPADPEPAFQQWVQARRRDAALRGELVSASPDQVFEAGWKAAVEALGLAACEAIEAEVAERTVCILAVRRVADLPPAIQEGVRRRHTAHVARLVASGVMRQAPEATGEVRP